MIRGAEFLPPKEWQEPLSEAAASKGVEKFGSIHIIKQDQTLLIIHKHPHFISLFVSGYTDWASVFIAKTNSPVTILRINTDFPLPID